MPQSKLNPIAMVKISQQFKRGVGCFDVNCSDILTEMAPSKTKLNLTEKICKIIYTNHPGPISQVCNMEPWMKRNKTSTVVMDQ